VVRANEKESKQDAKDKWVCPNAAPAFAARVISKLLDHMEPMCAPNFVMDVCMIFRDASVLQQAMGIFTIAASWRLDFILGFLDFLFSAFSLDSI
jgi:hypothetical protein